MAFRMIRMRCDSIDFRIIEPSLWNIVWVARRPFNMVDDGDMFLLTSMEKIHLEKFTLRFLSWWKKLSYYIGTSYSHHSNILSFKMIMKYLISLYCITVMQKTTNKQLALPQFTKPVLNEICLLSQQCWHMMGRCYNFIF